ncbi:MAG: hypothetical protein M3O70_07905 [Actinomycetota bacterium]|nr:hypothetical protein [Actinomycetota bacterium]
MSNSYDRAEEMARAERLDDLEAEITRLRDVIRRAWNALPDCGECQDVLREVIEED